VFRLLVWPHQLNVLSDPIGSSPPNPHTYAVALRQPLWSHVGRHADTCVADQDEAFANLPNRAAENGPHMGLIWQRLCRDGSSLLPVVTAIHSVKAGSPEKCSV
jgi:hypothetical protein